jgi:putative holliday junction resolvase
VSREGVTALVVGLPVELDGAEGSLARWVRDYSAALGRHVGLDVTFWDESFTSKQASDSMRERGIRAREQKEWIDAVAAAFILQDYLNARMGC